MATKKTGVLVGIAAIAVIGVAAVLYFSQWPPAEEDATGAIGAAERYRAEQITDEDVILDIPGQAELAEAVFEVLTDEQKAELFGSFGEAERTALLSQFKVDEAAFERMSERQIANLARSFDRKAQERIASSAQFNAKDLARWNDDTVALAFKSLNASDRAELLARSGVDEAMFQRSTVVQKAAYADFLGAKSFERSVLVARNFSRLSAAQLQAVWSNLGRGGQEAALLRAGFEADMARGSAIQRQENFERYMKERQSRD